jgi:hypothetical protein
MARKTCIIAEAVGAGHKVEANKAPVAKTKHFIL